MNEFGWTGDLGCLRASEWRLWTRLAAFRLRPFVTPRWRVQPWETSPLRIFSRTMPKTEF